nr:spore cortex biosynthesis protein YabQ [uncultured Cellulosilyticum sp.]
MNEIVSSQALLFITSIEIGIVMGMIFDLIRVIRKIVKHPSFFVQVEDLLYWIVCGLISFYMLYVTNYADIRPFILIGIILGAVFYFATFSIVFMKAATAVINYVKALLKRLWQLFLIPVKWCIKTIKRPIIYAKKQLAIEKERQYVAYRKKQRVKYQQEADRQTEKYINEKLKKINLEEKRNEKLKKQAEEAHKKEMLVKKKNENEAEQRPVKKRRPMEERKKSAQ